jgi:hypothetical protein
MRMANKMILFSVVLALMASPALAGNCPEFDAVGLDSSNYFNNVTNQRVVENNVVGGNRLNDYSDWLMYPEMVNGAYVFEEFFTTAGVLYGDPCFENYDSALIDAYNAADYRWRIILQMKPQSDLNLNIVDCVMRHGESDVWSRAGQTGRYRAEWGQLFFVLSGNPTVTVRAIPGPYATPGFEQPFIMDARLLPGLSLLCLNHALYTSKALWEEGIVIVRPKNGELTTCGETAYDLKQGDAIEVTVSVPGTNTSDIRYGKDNVMLRYIGIVGTYFMNLHAE